MKFVISVCFENVSRKFNFYWNQARITGALREYLYVVMIIYLSVVLEWEMFQTKVVDTVKALIL